MAEGQGNGNDSPERDSSWQPVPGAAGSPGDGTPEADTDPGAPEAAHPGASWFPFRMTSDAGEAGQPAPGPEASPGPQAAPGPQASPGPQAAPGPQPAPGPAQQPQPLGGLSSPWQAQPGTQPSWAPPTPPTPAAPAVPTGPAAPQQSWPQQSWHPPGAQPGQPGPGAQPPAGTQPPAAGQAPAGAQSPAGAQPPAGTQSPAGAQSPAGTQPPGGGWAPAGAQPQYGYGAAQGAQPGYGTPPPGYSGQPPYAGQTPYAGQPPAGPGPTTPHSAGPGPTTPPYGGQPTYPTQPIGQAYYAGQPPYPGQPAIPGQPVYPGQPGYPGQPPYGQPGYADQPQAGWQPQPAAGHVPPLPGELPGGVPPGGEGHWAPPGGYGQPPAGPPRQRKPMGTALIYLMVALLAAAVGAGAVLALRGSAGQAPSSAASRDIPQPKPAKPGSGTLNGSVASKVEPGLADITSYVHLQREVFEGTGMVLSANGLVLTNNHVIKGSTRIVVQLVSTGRKYTAQVVGTDNAHDVALLRLQGASGLKTVQVGNSDSVKLGDAVVALGNAGGTGGTPTVTNGVITALHRNITASDAGSRTSESLTNMFQTNAPIAEGDSGGALANTAGQVIAMNTAANSQNIGGNGTSQGFSIPINRALGIAREIAAGHGSSTIQIGQPPFLGIAIASMANAKTSTATSPREQLRQFEAIAQANFGAVNSSGRCLPNANANPVPNSIAPAKSGALIGAVFCNEPAAAAGAQAGDVITAVNGQSVTSAASLHDVIHQYRPGDTVKLTVTEPSGQQRNLSFKLGAGPAA